MEDEHFIPAKWSVLPRGDVAPHWSRIYVTMNRGGSIVLSKTTVERLGCPEAVLIMLDTMNFRLALKPAKATEQNAYPLRRYGRSGGKIIRAYRLLTEFGLKAPDTVEFIEPMLDEEGKLILNLNKIRISPKAHSQCRANDKAEN